MERWFLFADVETTGHEPLRSVDGALMRWHEIIEVGAVAWDGRAVLEEFQTKVRPEHPERCIPDIINHYPARAARGEWDRGVTFQHAMVDLYRFAVRWADAAGQPLVLAGQNFSFDWLFLSVAFAAAGISEERLARVFHYARLDTRSMAVAQLWRPLTDYEPADYSIRTDGLSQVLRIPPEPVPHEALNGARQALAVFRALRALKGGGR